jgi:subfamily B ATP-binding cassette protein MsbA
MKPLLKMKKYLLPHWRFIAGSLSLAIPLAALRAAPAPLLKYLVDDVLVQKDLKHLYQLPLWMVGLYVVNFFVRFAHYYWVRIAIARANQSLKNDLFEHLIGLSPDYFSAQSTGTLMSRVANDTNYVDGAISSLNVILREPFTFIILLGYAFHLNYRLTIISLAILPPLAWVFTASGRNLKRYIGKLTEESAKMFSAMQESFVGIRVVKMFQLEKYARKKFRSRSEAYAHFYLKIAKLEEASHPLVELFLAFVLAAMIYYGGKQVVAGRMTSGDLTAFFATFALMVNPIKSLNEVGMKLQQASAACERIFKVFEWRSTIVETPEPLPLHGLEREVRFKDVSFAYPDAPSREVLRRVNFTIPKSKTVAIVGASGSGKSSLASLLPRIFDVTGGRIEIDGHDIRNYSLEELRSQIAVVSQDVFLFNDSIAENIRCGRLSAPIDDIHEAARRAHAADFIESLPDGFNTIIGDRGQKLSGGERQRLSIARAFLREAPILILDEATSSLDSASERAVQEALDALMVNRTTLVIAHRLSTVRGADTILVLKDGEIVESGRHDELIKIGGEYSRFHEIQGSS